MQGIRSLLEPIKGFAIGLSDTVAQGSLQAIENFDNLFLEPLSNAFAWAQNKLSDFGDYFGMIGARIGGILGGVITLGVDIVAASITNLQARIDLIPASIEFVQGVWEFLKAGVLSGIDNIKSFWAGAMAEMQAAWQGAIDFYLLLFTSLGESIKIIWDGVINAIKFGIDAAKIAIEFALAQIQAAWDRVSATVVALWQNAMNLIQSGMDRARAFINSAVQAIAAAWRTVSAAVSSVAAGIMAQMGRAADFIRTRFSGLGTLIARALQPVITVANSIYSAFSRWLAPLNSAITQIRNLANQIRNLPGLPNFGGFGGLDGARAAGGPVRRSGSYLVGELGPEIFTPHTNGYIVPNNQIAGFRAEGGPVEAGRSYVVGEIGAEAFLSGSGVSTLRLDFTALLEPIRSWFGSVVGAVHSLAERMIGQASPIRSWLGSVVGAVHSLGERSLKCNSRFTG